MAIICVLDGTVSFVRFQTGVSKTKGHFEVSNMSIKSYNRIIDSNVQKFSTIDISCFSNILKEVTDGDYIKICAEITLNMYLDKKTQKMVFKHRVSSVISLIKHVVIKEEKKGKEKKLQTISKEDLDILTSLDRREHIEEEEEEEL